MLSKWLFTEPEVLILDEPTRGIDVGAKYEIYTIINQLAAEGKGILMISSEMPELLGICDRIYVMNEGRIVAELPESEASQESIMRAIVRSGEESTNGHRNQRHRKQRQSIARLSAKQTSANTACWSRSSSSWCSSSIITGGVLFKPVNLTNLVLQNSFIVIMALGMLLVIVAGHIDLSVGSIVAFIGGCRRSC